MADWVKVGAEVVEVMYGSPFGTLYGPTRKIAKVYENGDFEMDGETVQFRPLNAGVALTIGVGASWCRRRVLNLTDEVRAKVERSAAQILAAAAEIEARERSK